MRLVKLALWGALCSSILFGQAGTGTITGTVTDPAGASVPNAPVEVINSRDECRILARQALIPVRYTVTRLPPGPLQRHGNIAQGFKKLTPQAV